MFSLETKQFINSLAEIKYNNCIQLTAKFNTKALHRTKNEERKLTTIHKQQKRGIINHKHKALLRTIQLVLKDLFRVNYRAMWQCSTTELGCTRYHY
jgi:hypothetical protein